MTMPKPPFSSDRHRCIGGVDDVATVWAVDKRSNGRDEWDLIIQFNDGNSTFLDLFFTEGSSASLRGMQTNMMNKFMNENCLSEDQRYRCLLLVKLFAPNLWKPKRLPLTLRKFISRMEKTYA
jgi:hypothetical protein